MKIYVIETIGEYKCEIGIETSKDLHSEEINRCIEKLIEKLKGEKNDN